MATKRKGKAIVKPRKSSRLTGVDKQFADNKKAKTYIKSVPDKDYPSGYRNKGGFQYTKEHVKWQEEQSAKWAKERKEREASPEGVKRRKKRSGPRSSPVLKSSVAASKKAATKKATTKKTTAARKRLVKGSGPKSNLRVKSAAYYARKRAAAKKKK